MGAITKVESAYGFIKNQVDAFNAQKTKQKRQRYALLRRGVNVVTATILAIVITFPVNILGTPAQDTVADQQPTFTSTITLDKQSHSLLVIEKPTIDIKPGKSLEQERLAAEARKRAEAAARSKEQTIAQQITVPRAVAEHSTSTEEAHRMAKEAAAKAGIPEYWRELAAIWQVESGKMTYSCVVSKADGKAVGPMQFMRGTFKAYAADGDGDGNADICNAKDALVAAGNLLKRGGIADGNIDGAIHNYNHSMAYVNKVKKIAASIN